MKVPYQILKIFENIPADKLLQVAYQIRGQESFLDSSISQKDDLTFVTKADLEIQKILINYFLGSEIGQDCFFKAEEELPQNVNLSGTYKWQLIIDPLDGTASYAAFQDQWGVMVGLCNSIGELVYSWNLLSSGTIFPSFATAVNTISRTYIKEPQTFLIDFYSYSQIPHSTFYQKVRESDDLSVKESQIKLTTYPSGISAGWNLYSNQLDGLLWVSSSLQKQTYPDYDLTFLAALKQQGYQIRLGKISNQNEIVIVARDPMLVENLWTIALSLMPEAKKPLIKIENSLIITSPIKNKL